MHAIFLLLLAMPGKEELTVKSSAFNPDAYIPVKYSCKGENINPPLSIAGIPTEAKSLALIVDDPDAPRGTFDHWVVWNIGITGQTMEIKENTQPGMQGQNGMGKKSYMGPCPPSGIHHYHFKAYALDSQLDPDSNADKAAVEAAMKGHILAQGELIGLFKH